MIAKVANDAIRLDQKKPSQTTHDVNESFDRKNNQLQLNSSNYNNRIGSGKVSLSHSIIFSFIHSCLADDPNGGLWPTGGLHHSRPHGQSDWEIRQRDYGPSVRRQ